MLVQTARRVEDPKRYSRPLAIGSVRHGDLLREMLPDADILLEPVGRNSAPPICAACLMSNPDDLLLVLPADHHIADFNAFQEAILEGMEAAQQGRVVTFGINPNQPATGYGYIQEKEAAAKGPRAVARFVEKPNRETAEKYLAEGGFYWNSGIFLFKSGVMLESFEKFAPDIIATVKGALIDNMLDRAKFAQVRNESVDYAILEKAGNIDVVPVTMGWSDLGDYRALHEVSAGRFESDNVLIGPVVATKSSGVFVCSTGPRVAVHGLEDVAVVATAQAVLVSRLSDAASIKPAASTVEDYAQTFRGSDVQAWIRHWLWNDVMASWAKLCIDQTSGGFVECLDLGGAPALKAARRGRVAPRQLFSFSRAKRLGWNPDGAADHVIETAVAFLDGPARSPEGGWAHQFDGDGRISDPRRDLYDHAFVALAGSELAALGDMRGARFADEAFLLIDDLFSDEENGGWCDRETGGGVKLANPHMHLLEASLAHYEAFQDSRSHERIRTICALFEQHMFNARSDSVPEVFTTDWRPYEDAHVEPGHCYEWAYLLLQAEALTGRDTSSWARRLITFAETHGVSSGLVVDRQPAEEASFRLWPQLERLRALAVLPLAGADLPGLAENIRDRYLAIGEGHCWVDRLDAVFSPASSSVPASMIYHLMTGLAPFAPPEP